MADPDIRGANGLTPLDTASMMGRSATVSLLRARGAQRGELEVGVIEPGARAHRPPGARYRLTVISPGGKEIPELTEYGADLVETPYGGTTLVVSPGKRVSPSLQSFPSGARVEIRNLRTGDVVYERTY